MITLEQLRTKVERERGKFDRLRTELTKTQSAIIIHEEELQYIEQAKIIVQQVAQETQRQLEYFISDTVSLPLSAIFDNPYSFETEFVLRRGKTECDLYFVRNGKRVHPLDASGGGAVDVASFGLRLSLWSLNKNRPVIVLDEPFKHLSVNLHPQAMQMLKEVSERLNLQIIIVSHSEEIIEGADRIFKIGMNKEVSICQQEKT